MHPFKPALLPDRSRPGWAGAVFTSRSGVVPALSLFALIGCTSSLSTTTAVEQIDGLRAFEHVRRIVEYGPHPPGSAAQKEVGAYIQDQLASWEIAVETQTFTAVTPMGRKEMTNIWGVLPGDRDSVIVLASHYDTKYFPDFPFVGANDSGSSSGLLLELARVLAAGNPTDYTLWFLFLDGEEAFLEWTSTDSLYGSREFVKMQQATGGLRKITALVLMDMIGEKDLAFRQDLNSTPWLNELVWAKAAELGYERLFPARGKVAIQDDHLPFAQQGIPVIDIIDLDYAHWHRQEDTLDKLSPENMAAVGAVVFSSLPEIARRLDQGN